MILVLWTPRARVYLAKLNIALIRVYSVEYYMYVSVIKIVIILRNILLYASNRKTV